MKKSSLAAEQYFTEFINRYMHEQIDDAIVSIYSAMFACLNSIQDKNYTTVTQYTDFHQ